MSDKLLVILVMGLVLVLQVLSYRRRLRRGKPRFRAEDWMLNGAIDSFLLAFYFWSFHLSGAVWVVAIGVLLLFLMAILLVIRRKSAN
jgi:hypothetical protein